MTTMTTDLDHSTRQLELANELQKALSREYASSRPRPHEVGRLNAHMRHARELAAIHAQRAQVRALYDLSSIVAELARDLAAEPPPYGDTALELLPTPIRPELAAQLATLDPSGQA